MLSRCAGFGFSACPFSPSSLSLSLLSDCQISFLVARLKKPSAQVVPHTHPYIVHCFISLSAGKTNAKKVIYTHTYKGKGKRKRKNKRGKKERIFSAYWRNQVRCLSLSITIENGVAKNI